VILFYHEKRQKWEEGNAIEGERGRGGAEFLVPPAVAVSPSLGNLLVNRIPILFYVCVCLCVLAALSGGLNELQIAFVCREILKVSLG